MSRPEGIPEDVWSAVREALAGAGIPCTEADFGNGTVFEVEAEVMARAIIGGRYGARSCWGIGPL